MSRGNNLGCSSLFRTTRSARLSCYYIHSNLHIKIKLFQESDPYVEVDPWLEVPRFAHLHLPFQPVIISYTKIHNLRPLHTHSYAIRYYLRRCGGRCGGFYVKLIVLFVVLWGGIPKPKSSPRDLQIWWYDDLYIRINFKSVW